MSAKSGYLSNICLWTFYLLIFFISNNLAVGLYTDNGGIRRMNANSISYMWTVGSYSLNNLKRGESRNWFIFFGRDNQKYRWRLDLYPKGINYNTADWMSLMLVSQNEMKVTAYCRLSIIDGNGGITNTRSYTHTFVNSKGRGWANFVLQSDLKNKTKNLLPHDELTIYGEIMLIDETSTNSNLIPNDELTIYGETMLINDTNTDSSHCRYPSKLSDSENTAVQLLNEGFLSDVHVLIGGQIINAHRAILAAQSLWFADQFIKNPKSESVRMQNTTMATAWPAVRFMYTGKIEFDKSKVVEMLELSDRFGISKLKLLCEEILCKSSKSAKALKFSKPRDAKILV